MARDPTVLGVSEDGGRFTVDGQPTFLLGVSYYGAASVERPQTWRSELDRMRRAGFNWVRIWATWKSGDRDFSAVDSEGEPVEPCWPRLRDIIAYCDEVGMVVDVTLSRIHLKDHAAHLRAVSRLAGELKAYRNLYIDVANERSSTGAGHVSLEQASELIEAVKRVDDTWRGGRRGRQGGSAAPATPRQYGPPDMAPSDHVASLGYRPAPAPPPQHDRRDMLASGHDTGGAAVSRSRYLPERICTASDDVGDIPTEGVAPRIQAGLDIICPHRPRHADSAAETRADAERLRSAMSESGRIVPVHYQEPFRRDYDPDWEPTASDFLEDLEGAVRGGAAGWCFHNGDNRGNGARNLLCEAPGGPSRQKVPGTVSPHRSFDMSEHGLFEQLDRDELDVFAASGLVVEQALKLPADVPFAAFVDRTEATGGLEGVAPHGGHGAGICDIDDSGLEDVYVSNSGMGITPNILALNRGAFRFDVLPDAGGAAMVFDEDDWSHGFSFADFDADGRYELFVSAARGPHRMFRWAGDRFEDITAESGISGEKLGTRGVAVGDFTGDGTLDIFCLNNRESYNSEEKDVVCNDLFLGDGRGRFTRADTRALGLADPRPPQHNGPRSPRLQGLGQGVAAADFDGDGQLEIYTCIRFMPNRLWRRGPGGTWRDVAPSAGVDCTDGGDGAVFCDLWNRGLLDLVVAGSDGPETPYLRIYRNRGDGTYEDLTQRYQIRAKSYHVTVADFNANGFLDLYVTRDYEPNCLYLNDGRGGFIPVRAGVETELQDARCSVAGDLDGDGRLDLVVAHKRDFNRVYRNLSVCRNWVQVSLVGPRGDRGAVGARVFVYRSGASGDPEGLLGFREARSAYGYVGQDSPRLYFGLGGARAADIRVRFPDGTARELRDVPSRSTVTVDAREE